MTQRKQEARMKRVVAAGFKGVKKPKKDVLNRLRKTHRAWGWGWSWEQGGEWPTRCSEILGWVPDSLWDVWWSPELFYLDIKGKPGPWKAGVHGEFRLFCSRDLLFQRGKAVRWQIFREFPTCLLGWYLCCLTSNKSKNFKRSLGIRGSHLKAFHSYLETNFP